MEVRKLLDSISLPDIYYRNGKSCYYDTYRKKLIEITPEETVRQKVALLFEKFFGVPKNMIFLEVPMHKYTDNVAGRADIIIHEMDYENNVLYPVAVIECKNESVVLTDKVVEQSIRYCDIIGGKYIIVTNGIELEFAVYEEDTNQYIFLQEILSYKKMINKEYEIPNIKEEEIKRFSLDELNDQKLILEYNDSGTWIFGKESKNNIKSFAVNLFQSLLDTKHKLPITKQKTFELIEDIGIRFMDYGNAGGGHYCGDYRSFLIKDRFGEPQIVSFSIFGTDPNFCGEKRRSYTSLTVSIDHFKTSHNSLQYNIDRFSKISNNCISFLHNGQISGLKSTEVLNAVKEKGEYLKVDSANIYLGDISINKLLYLDDYDVAKLIYNLIEYALLREEVRNNKKPK